MIGSSYNVYKVQRLPRSRSSPPAGEHSVREAPRKVPASKADIGVLVIAMLKKPKDKTNQQMHNCVGAFPLLFFAEFRRLNKWLEAKNHQRRISQ